MLYTVLVIFKKNGKKNHGVGDDMGRNLSAIIEVASTNGNVLLTWRFVVVFFPSSTCTKKKNRGMLN